MQRFTVRMFGFMAALAAGAFTAGRSEAVEQVCNMAAANFTNSATTFLPAVSSTVCFDAQSNPVLTVTKVKVSPAGSVAVGQLVTFMVTVAYPRLTLPLPDPAACDDDSAALNVVISDPIPSGPTGFTYVANTLEYSYDGAAFAARTDAADGDELQVSGATVSTNPTPGVIPTLYEGDGGSSFPCERPARNIRIRFQATKN